jgi:sulfur relay (sulfurtransferase) complex TusBCD TusD component (DsrE family)
MSLRGKKLGLLLSAPPGQPGFEHGVNLAEAALAEGVEVYLYCIDEALRGIEEPRLQGLAGRGVRLFACAYSADRRLLARTDKAAFAGLASLSDLMAGTDRFVSFN